LFHLVGYLHRCTKMMHGHTNIKFIPTKFCLPINHWRSYSLHPTVLFKAWGIQCFSRTSYFKYLLQHISVISNKPWGSTIRRWKHDAPV